MLKGIQQGMKLPARTMIPSFAALSYYGNTSSSTTWYSMTYLESLVGIKKGERIMQIGCGGGMKVMIGRTVHDADNRTSRLLQPVSGPANQ